MNNQKHRVIVLMAFLFLALVAWAGADTSYYDQVDYTAIVHKDNTWDVTETTKVMFTQPHHGITRWLRKRYKMTFHKQLLGFSHDVERTFRSQITFNDSAFKIDGKQTDEYDLSDDDDDISIRMGSEFVTLTGTHTFSYAYTTIIPDDGFGDKDVLTKTIVPRAMEAPTKTLNVIIKFDGPLPANAASMMKVIKGGYSYPNTDQTKYFQIVDSHTIQGTMHDIPAYCAVTLRMELPQGFFDTVPDNPWHHLFFFFLVLTALLALYIIIKSLFHKPQIVTKQIEFYPPEGLSSAEVGIIIDNKVDDNDIASMIPWFASQGYITIKQVKNDANKVDLILKRIKSLPDSAPLYQQTFMKALFDEQGTEEINLKDIQYTEMMQQTSEEMKKIYTDDKKLVKSSNADMLAILLLLLGFCSLITNSNDDFWSWSTLWTSLIYGVTYLVTGLIGWCWVEISASDPEDSIWSKVKWGAVRLVIMVVIFMVLTFFYEDFYSSDLAFLTFAISWLGVEFFAGLYSSTSFRLQYLGKLLGLKEFIKTAEKPRLEQLIDDDPDYFYKILPYAMALGVATKWGEKFQNIQIHNPKWIENDESDISLFTTTYYASDLISTLTSASSNAISKAAEQPSSTSSWSDHSDYDSDYSFDSDGDAGGGDGDGGGGFW